MSLTLIAIYTALGAFLGKILSLKFLFVQTIRLRDSQYHYLYKCIEKYTGVKFILEDQISQRDDESSRSPSVFSGFFWINDFPPFYLSSQERELKAGYRGIDTLTTITFMRWHKSNFVKFFSNIKLDSTTIDIIMIQGGGSKYLGSLLKNTDCKIPPILEDFEHDVQRIIAGDKIKTSALLYGLPGNGKTTSVRNIALKYGLDIYLVNFSKEINNEDILTMAIYDKKPKIILFEDFDNIFNHRKLLLPDTSAKCSFDAILNALDGVFNDTPNTIYVFTANDLSKIDSALTDRPSRIKHKIEILNPNFDVIQEIIGHPETSYKLLGNNLDVIYTAKARLDKNKDISKFFKYFGAESPPP